MFCPKLSIEQSSTYLELYELAIALHQPQFLPNLIFYYYFLIIYRAKSFTVVLGAHNVTDENEAGTLRVETSTKVVHKDWNSFLLRNDIALVKLPSPVQLNGIIYEYRIKPFANS